MSSHSPADLSIWKLCRDLTRRLRRRVEAGDGLDHEAMASALKLARTPAGETVELPADLVDLAIQHFEGEIKGRAGRNKDTIEKENFKSLCRVEYHERRRNGERSQDIINEMVKEEGVSHERMRDWLFPNRRRSNGRK